MPNHTVRSAGIWAGLACYWLGLFVATHVPTDMVSLPGQVSDKLPHFLAYAGLAILLAAAWQITAGRLSWRQLCGAWVLLVFYAAIDESTQIPVGRHASIWDWVADLAGAAAGLAIFLGWNRCRRAGGASSKPST